jgi:putative membrane protein
MKFVAYLLGLTGLAISIALVLNQGWAAIAQVFTQGGWSLLWLVPFHALPLLLDTFGWRVLLSSSDPSQRAPTLFLFWVATVREAASRLLPLASVGGDLIGIRLVTLRGLDGASVSASVLIEILLTVLNQTLFSALGVAVLISMTQATPLTQTMLIGLGLSLPMVIGLFVLLRYGAVFERIERFAKRALASANVLAAFGGKGLDAAIQKLLRRRAGLCAALSWQLACYVIGSFETWLALRLLGHTVTPAAAIALEAMAQAVRHFIFFVPAGLGVQEGGLILIGQLIGIPADFALALSLTKRAREVLFGLPALLSWQWIEGARLRAMWSRRTGIKNSSDFS